FYDNPMGYRFVEFPVYNVAQAGLFKIFGLFSIEQWGRIVSIFSSLLAGFFLYLMVKKYQSKLAGILSLFFFTFLPYNIYYGRTVLPDAMMLMTLLGGIYFFDLWLDRKELTIIDFRFAISLIFIATAFLLKPFTLFFTLPLITLSFNKFGLGLFKKWRLWFFLIVSVFPLILWRIWILQHPEGIPRSDWLFNMNNVRFKGAFFSWIFEKRIAILILGGWGLPLFILGLIQKIKIKNYLFFISFVVSSLFYIFVIAGGNVHHDYYQIPVVPSLVIFLALGAEFLLRLNSTFLRRIMGISLFTICTLFMLAFSWQDIRAYYNINNPAIVRAGRAVSNLIPKDAKVIAPYNGDTSFLYQINRQGWASFEKDLKIMIKMGADYVVIPNPTSHDIGKTYKIISYSKDYILVDLHQKP
ncbi:MAG: glycosyltransferase family 39 protein, partial [Candidatus Pacearchaeota archaeon]